VLSGSHSIEELDGLSRILADLRSVLLQQFQAIKGCMVSAVVPSWRWLHTVEGNYQDYGALTDPVLDFGDVVGQGRVIHHAVNGFFGRHDSKFGSGGLEDRRNSPSNHVRGGDIV
jgi:hypothetical protein